MNSVLFSSEFKRKIKPLAKKHRTLRDSVDQLGVKLMENPFLGDSYGSNLYKVRLADESKGKGKSGGFRVIYYLSTKTEHGFRIVLVTVFDKSELDTITKKEAEEILKKVLVELKND